MSTGDGSRACDRSRPDWVTRTLVLLVDLYRHSLGPLLGGWCRFQPSCSAYAREALIRYGSVRGTTLTLQRLLRCQPLGRGGYDPVP